jgi:hypothetical protein
MAFAQVHGAVKPQAAPDAAAKTVPKRWQNHLLGTVAFPLPVYKMIPGIFSQAAPQNRQIFGKSL